MNKTTITFTDALSILVSIVKEFGADYTPAPNGSSQGCIYIKRVDGYADPHNLVPVCIVGQVFGRLGITRALLRDNEAGGDQYGTCSIGEPMWDNAVAMGVTFNEDVKHFLREAQNQQDNGVLWGEAVRKAVTYAQKRAEQEALRNLPTHGYDVETLVMSIPAPKPNENDVARENGDVRDFMRAGQRINAIKVVRQVTGCGLKEAKEAVERVYPIGYDATAL